MGIYARSRRSFKFTFGQPARELQEIITNTRKDGLALDDKASRIQLITKAENIILKENSSLIEQIDNCKLI